MERDQIISQVRALRWPDGQYVVTGGAALAVHGIRPTNDIDIMVTPGLHAVLKQKYPEFKEGHLRISEDIETKNAAMSIADDPSKLIADADLIDGVPFVRIADLRVLKGKKGRDKDICDIVLIDEYLAGVRASTAG